MSKFTDTVQVDTPRLVVAFRRGPDGSEEFQWGIVGSIPILSLIGCVVRAQVEMELISLDSPCDQPAFVITWDAASRRASYFVHPDIPTDSLVGMLETIKAALVGSRLAQHQAAQRILGPDGAVMRR